MTEIKFKSYGGDAETKYTESNFKHALVFEKIIEWCKKKNCYNGETLHQSDSCTLTVGELVSDIIDDIIKFETKWIGD